MTGKVLVIKICPKDFRNTDEKGLWFRKYGAFIVNEGVVTQERILVRGNELARQFGVTNSTIKYYTILGLLEVADTTTGGMKLYDYYPTKKRIREIRDFREKDISIKEIQKHYGIIE